VSCSSNVCAANPGPNGAFVHVLAPLCGAGQTHAFQAWAISPDGKTLASSSWGGTVQLWDAATGKCTAVFKDAGHFVGFSQDGKTLLSARCVAGRGAEVDYVVTTWELGTDRAIRTLAVQRSGKGPGNCMAYAPDAKLLATGMENTINLWDLKPGNSADK